MAHPPQLVELYASEVAAGGQLPTLNAVWAAFCTMAEVPITGFDGDRWEDLVQVSVGEGDAADTWEVVIARMFQLAAPDDARAIDHWLGVTVTVGTTELHVLDEFGRPPHTPSGDGRLTNGLGSALDRQTWSGFQEVCHRQLRLDVNGSCRCLRHEVELVEEELLL